GFARQPDMPHLALVGERPEIGINLVLAERGDRQRRHEFLRRLGQDAAHDGAALAQPPDELEALIGSDAARDDQEETPAVQHERTVKLWKQIICTLSAA